MKKDHVVVAQADAAVAGRGADELFLIRAVDVDQAPEGVGIFGVQSVEGQDAGQDEVLRDAGCGHFTGPFSRPEHGPSRGALADFVVDDESSRRGPEAAFLAAEAEARGGDGEFGGYARPFHHAQGLAGHIDYEAPGGGCRRGGRPRP